MAFERVESVESVTVKLLNGQVCVNKTVSNQVDGEEVSVNSYETFHNNGDDLSEYPEIVQQIANLFWSSL